MTHICPICLSFDRDRPRSPHVESESENSDVHIGCTRCGNYTCERALFDLAVDRNRAPFEEEQALALSWAARNATNAVPMGSPTGFRLSFDTCSSIADGVPFPTEPGHHYDLLLDLVARRSRFPGRPSSDTYAEEVAALVFLPEMAMHSVVEQLANAGMVQLRGSGPARFSLRLTEQGWRRATGISTARRSDRAFVAMWFDRTMRPAYTEGIAAALDACGYSRPFRTDDPEHDARAGSPEHDNRIDNRVMAEIRRARFIVADATGARQSVYYEAGFAEGLGVPVIWTCRRDHESQLSFDTRQVAHILWSTPSELCTELVAKIERHGWSLKPERASQILSRG